MKVNNVEIDIITNPKNRLKNLKKLAGELREETLNRYPNLLETDIEFLTTLLRMELKKLFESL